MVDTHRLPHPVAEIYEWQLRGACRGMDSAVFFHPEGERGAARTSRETQAKKVCRRCVVLEQCRRHALSAGEPYGVWGGMSVTERDAVIRRRQRTLNLADEPSPVH